MRFFYLLVFCCFYLSATAQNRVSNIRFRSIDSARLEIQYDLLNTRPGDSIYVQIRSRIRGTLRIRPELIQGDIGMNVPAGSDRRVVWNARANGYTLNEEIKVSVLIRTHVPIAASTAAAARRASRPSQPTASEPPVTNPATPKPAVTPVLTEPVQTPPAPTTAITAAPATPPTLTDTEVAPTSTRSSNRYVGPAWALLSAVAPGIGNIFVQTPRPRVGFRPIVFATTYSLMVC